MFWLTALNMIWLGGKKSHSLLILDGVLEGLKLICTHSHPRALSKRLEVSSRCSCLLSQSGCSFGGRFYSLEDTWHPDLGEPFGVMHCVMCHCEPVTRQTHSAFHNISTLRVWCYMFACVVDKKIVCILFLFKHAKYMFK